MPEFKGTLPNIPPVKRFSAALKRHDWNRNPNIYQLRCDNNQRVSVRSERRETYYALALTMIAYADYSPECEGLFEVMCSVENLAKYCNQLHKYENGRKSYDPILHAIHDWEKANLIIVDEDFCREAKQYKAMRIWLRPEFFKGLGFSLKELREVVNSFKRWMEKNGLRDDYKKRYAEHVIRLSRSNVASLDNKHSLKNLLKKLKRLVVGNDPELSREKEHAIKAALHKKALIEATQAPETETERYFKLYTRWNVQQPRAISMAFENDIKNRYPNVRGDALYQLYVEHLPDS